MSSEEDIYCSNCNNQTDQSLFLSCDHNFCFVCASELLRAQNISNYNNYQNIKCSLCERTTLLEPDTIKQILIAGYKNFDENNDNNNYINLENENNNLNEFENKLNKKNKNSQNEIINNNISTSELNIINDLTYYKQLCKEHAEPFTYLCLDCMSNCICAECIVHGIHRDHDVLTIKKAYPLICKKLEDLSKYADDQKKSILLINETISKKKDCINALIERCKSEIHSIFEQIKLKLDNKEKEIINNTTSILHKSIDDLNNYDNSLQKNSGNLEDIIAKINNILRKKDELNTINFIPNLDAFTNIKIEPNKSKFNDMMKGINNFNFNITNIKGLEMNINQTKKIPKNIQKRKIKQQYFNNMNNNINNNYINQNLQMNYNELNNNNNDIYYTEMPNNFDNFNEFNNKNNAPFNNKLKKIRPETAKPSKRKNKINNMNNMNFIRNQNNTDERNYNNMNFDYNFI